MASLRSDGSHKPLKGRRILIAEDNALLVLDIADALSEAGAEIVGPVVSVKNGLLLAQSEPLDAGVLDINLKGGNVFPIARILADQGKGIVFVTGMQDISAIEEDWPTARVLTKPAFPQSLIEATVAVCRTVTPS
jgi:DNA-binding NarL/FixJ family response regulator